MSSKSVAALAGASVLALYSSVGMAAGEQSKYNLPEPQSVIATEIYDMHIWLMWICVVIFVGVFGVMFYSILKHRKSLGYKAANFHHSTSVEIVWTVIPCIILIVMAYPATKTVIAMKDTSSPDMTIKATGYQWMWGYDYLTGEGEGISFYSRLSTPRAQIENKEPKGENYLLEVDNRVVVPVGKKVRVIITANDVIHAWWVPDFAVKQDANPGFINEAWAIVPEPGIYRGQCAELCGKDHGFMPIVVEVKSEADYAVWIEEQNELIANAAAAEAASLNASLSKEELMQLGETTYTAYCAACHQPTGLGLPPAFPALKGSPVTTSGSVADHINIVFNGKAGTGMQGYGKQLSMKEIAAVVTYERNAWGNDTGDVVQASDVKAASSGAGAAVTEKAADAVTDLVKEAVAAPVEDLTKQYSLDELMAKGEIVYNTTCVACHQATGAGLPPAFPSLIGSPITTGDVNAHIDIVVNGSKKNPSMAAFGSQLSKTDIAAVITFERNAWGNNTGDVVQPADIAASAK